MAYKDKDKQREAAARHYEKNRTAMKDRAAAYNKSHREDIRNFILSYLNEHPCVDCGESDPVVLEFDHVGEKLFTIGNAQSSGYSIKKIQNEIEKCEVRCANCHRRKTYKQFARFGRG